MGNAGSWTPQQSRKGPYASDRSTVEMARGQRCDSEAERGDAGVNKTLDREQDKKQRGAQIYTGKIKVT